MKKIQSLNDLSQLADYDPLSLSVEQAQEYITNFIDPIGDSETVEIMQSLGRVTLKDVISLSGRRFKN